MIRTIRIHAFITLLLAASSATAAPPTDIDAQVARALETFGVPGMSLAIVENDKTVLAKGYGLRKLGESARADEHTIFPIGSCTKAFTASALAILVDEGKLAWDDRVIDRLPGFRMYDAYTTSEMTIRDLLVHRSGLGLGAGDLLFFPPTTYTRKELIQQLRHIKPATSFRSGYAYDNVLYIVAGQVVEQVSGLTWEAFVEQRLLAPLAMKDALTQDRHVLDRKNRGWPHARFEGPLRGLGPVKPMTGDAERTLSQNAGPAGSINASASDMGEWLKVQLAQGALPDGKRLYSEASANEMWLPHVVMPQGKLPASLSLRKANFTAYALGWMVTDYRGHKIITHSGAVEGGLAAVVLIPETHTGIAVMINSEDGAARWAVFYRLLDHYLGLPPHDWLAAYKTAVDETNAKGLAEFKKQPAGMTKSGSSHSLPLHSYAGVYSDPWYGTVTIAPAGKKSLNIQFDRTPGMKGALEHVRHDTFRTRFTDRTIEDTYVTFALKPDGSIERIKMQAISPLADFSFDFHDLLFTPVKPEKTQ